MTPSVSPSPKATRHFIWPIILPLLGFFMAVGAYWLPTARFGFDAQFLAVLTPVVFLTAIVAIPVAFGLILCGRPRAVLYLLSAICVVGTIFSGFAIGRKWRMEAFHALAERSMPLVAAIREYETQRGEPPHRLDDLVPQFLPTVPSTGMGGYPSYNYFVGAEADEYGGNPWALEVFTPGPGINFDCFIYYPDQNYPETGFGGSLERIGAWAYVHE
jgi:hypothetical protein